MMLEPTVSHDVAVSSCSLGQGTRGRRVYLAGAYTAAAAGSNGEASRLNGAIHAGSRWRQILEETERALRVDGWAVFLPHRDVSRWGARNVAPADVASESLAAVATSHVMIAILGESFGTHVEVGTALGLGIPTIIVRLAGGSESYFGSGVAESELVSTIVLPSVEDLPSAVTAGSFEEALARAAVTHLAVRGSAER